MNKLTPIPTPWHIKWHALRLRVVPVIVLIAAVAALVSQWRRLDGAGISGIAEGVRSVVTSPQAGLLSEVKVQPYEWIEAGQPLATLLPLDPRSKFDLLQTELQLARLRLEPSLSDQNALDFERLRVESLRLKQELATAQVNLQMAENALRRNVALRDEKLVSEDAYDLSLRDRDMYRAEIAEKSKAVAQIDERLAKLRAVGEPEQPGSNLPVRALVTHLDARLQQLGTNCDLVTLVSPISGMVHFVNRQRGESVVEGEPLVSVNATNSDRIVGYLRQPYSIEPERGLRVEVVTRSRHRQKFGSQIVQIGAQVETITNALATFRLGTLVDVGLPIVVGIPPGVSIRPGEVVDIHFLPKAIESGREGFELGSRQAL